MNQPEEIKLLPCPFCGSPAGITHWSAHVGCSSKECPAYMCNLLPAQWNTRTPNEATKEFLEDKAMLEWAMMNPHKFTKLMEMEAYGGFLTEELTKGRTAIFYAMKQDSSL